MCSRVFTSLSNSKTIQLNWTTLYWLLHKFISKVSKMSRMTDHWRRLICRTSVRGDDMLVSTANHLRFMRHERMMETASSPSREGPHLFSSFSSWPSSPELCPHSSAGPSWCPAALQGPSGEHTVVNGTWQCFNCVSRWCSQVGSLRLNCSIHYKHNSNIKAAIFK